MQLLKQDRLIKLPDDMLLSILERLGTLDALRACLVSKRMLNLPAMLSHIHIALGSRDLYQMNDVVADVIDKMLRRTPQVPIRRLKARFILRPRDCVSIGGSFAFAMATQKLDAAEFKILAPDTSHCWSSSAACRGPGRGGDMAHVSPLPPAACDLHPLCLRRRWLRYHLLHHVHRTTQRLGSLLAIVSSLKVDFDELSTMLWCVR
jgi:hypothetical protein